MYEYECFVFKIGCLCEYDGEMQLCTLDDKKDSADFATLEYLLSRI